MKKGPSSLIPHPSSLFLPARELDDELLVELLVLRQPRVHVAAGGQAGQAAFGRLAAGDLQEVGDRLRVRLMVQLDQLDPLGPVLDAHLVARLEDKAGDVALAAVDQDVAVGDQLPSRGSRRGEAEAVYDVVEAALHDAEQHLAGVLGRARSEGEVAAELLLQHAVESLQLLLLAEADAVFAELAAAVVHAGRGVAALDGALGALAATTLEVELDAFAAAELADRVDVTCHVRRGPAGEGQNRVSLHGTPPPARPPRRGHGSVLP